MDAVKEFNAELCSLYDIHPPITKAKMTQITKAAIKAIKFYKHVVQSVEKFIQKCRQEYKVPGLYIIDSIIRHSRKQFGPDKDMFAPRFSKNIVITFHNLFECPQEDISKMIRVLNLWQKNGVYHPGIIQPLLDLASDPHNPAVFETVQKQIEQVTGLTPSMPLKCDQKPPALTADALQLGSGLDLIKTDFPGDFSKVFNQLMQSVVPNPVPQLTLNPQLQLLQQLLTQQLPVPLAATSNPLLQNSARFPSSSTSCIDNSLVGQIQLLTQQLLGQAPVSSVQPAANLQPPAVVPVSNQQLQKQEANVQDKTERECGSENEEEDGENEREESQQMSSLDKRIMFMCQEEGEEDGHEDETTHNEQNNWSKKHSHSKRAVVGDGRKSTPGKRGRSEYESDAEPVSMTPSTPEGESSRRSSKSYSNYDEGAGGVVSEQTSDKQRGTRTLMREPDDGDEEDDREDDACNESDVEDEEIERRSEYSDVDDSHSHRSGRKRKRISDGSESRSHKSRTKSRSRNYSDHDGEYYDGKNVESDADEGKEVYDNVGHRSRKSKHKSRSIEKSAKQKKSEKYYPSPADDLREKSRHKKKHREKYSSTSSVGREHSGLISKGESKNSDAFEKQSRSSNHQVGHDTGESLVEYSGHSKGGRSRNVLPSNSPSRKKRKTEFTVEYGTNEDNMDDDDDDDVIFIDMQKKSVDVSRFLEKKLPSLKAKEKHTSRSSSRGSSVEFIGQDAKSSKEKEGMPPIKPEMMSICSTTLWIGHLNKLTSEEELKGELKGYGEITINLVLPRGCAYICFQTRKNAHKALGHLKNITIQGNNLKVAWAVGVGVKNSLFYEKYDVDLGVTYVPWNQLLSQDLPTLLEGSIADEDSLPHDFDRELLKVRKPKKKKKSQGAENAPSNETTMNPSLIPLPQPLLPPLPSIPPPPLPPINNIPSSSSLVSQIQMTNSSSVMLPSMGHPSSASLDGHSLSSVIHNPPPMLGTMKDFPPVSFDPSIPPPSLPFIPLPPSDNRVHPTAMLPPLPISSSSSNSFVGNDAPDFPAKINGTPVESCQRSFTPSYDGASNLSVAVSNQMDVTVDHSSLPMHNATASLIQPPQTNSSSSLTMFNKPPPHLTNAALLPVSSNNILPLPRIDQVIMVDKPPPQVTLLQNSTNIAGQSRLDNHLSISDGIMRSMAPPQMNNLERPLMTMGQLVHQRMALDGRVPIHEQTGNQLLVGRGVILPSLGMMSVSQLRPNLFQPPPSTLPVSNVSGQDNVKRLPVPSEFLRRLSSSESSVSSGSSSMSSSKQMPVMAMPAVNFPPPSFHLSSSSSPMPNALPQQTTDDIQRSVTPNIAENAANPDGSANEFTDLSDSSKPFKKPPLLETPPVPDNRFFRNSSVPPQLPHPSQILNMKHPAYNSINLQNSTKCDTMASTMPTRAQMPNFDRFRTPRPPKIGGLPNNNLTPTQQNPASFIFNFQGTSSSNPAEMLISEALKSLSPLVRIPGMPLINPANFLSGTNLLARANMVRLPMRGPNPRGNFQLAEIRSSPRPNGGHHHPSPPPRHRLNLSQNNQP